MGDAHSATHGATAEIGALRELKRVEAQVRDGRAQAESDAKAVVAGAFEQARSIREDAEAQGRHTYDTAMAQSRRDAETKAKSIVDHGRRDADAIRAKARSPAATAAVDRVLAEFRRRAGGR